MQRCYSLGLGTVFLALLLGVLPMQAQVSPATFEVLPDYAAGNAMADRLRAAPAKFYNFDRAALWDVLRFLADDAGIPFISLQETGLPAPGMVTFTMRASPFTALESIARANGIALLFENGVWLLRPYKPNELIGRIYRLRYDPQQNVTLKANDTATQSQPNAPTNNGVPDLDINIQGMTDIFKVRTPAIVDQIRSLLGIKPTDTDTGGQNSSPRPSSDYSAKGDEGSQVVYNADMNTVFVVATREQHARVEGFLDAVDRPQALIAIEVKFFETTKDPSKELGINWAQTMQGGYNVVLSQQLEATSGIGFDVQNEQNNNTSSTTQNSNANGNLSGVPQSGNPYNFQSGLNSVVGDGLDIYNSIQSYGAGMGAAYTAVLQPKDVNFAIQAFMDDRETSVVQYPRALTINNREVVIRSVINEPILSGTTSATVGAGATTASSISYLPIGTIINVLPKTMPDNSVVLNVAITVSSIVGYVPINDGTSVNNYPRASSRIYNASLQVDSGYTLAVGGIEQAEDANTKNGIPLLQDIPGLGILFKSKARSQKKRNLIIFITPTIIHDRKASGGIAETPQTTLPVRPDEPQPPAFTTNGRLVGGMGALDEAMAWLKRQADYFQMINEENRTDRDSIKQLEHCINTANMILAEIEGLQVESPERLRLLVSKQETILGLLKRLNDIRVKAKKNIVL